MNIGSSYNTTASNDIGGRVFLLFLLFAMGMYGLATTGLPGLALITIIPIAIFFIYITFKYEMFSFWILFAINYLLMFISRHFSIPIPMSLPNEMLEIILIMVAMIKIRGFEFQNCLNIMGLMIFIWIIYGLLQSLNNTMGLGLNWASWFQGFRVNFIFLLYIFLVHSLYISTPNRLKNYIIGFALFSLFGAIWTWKQKNIGFTHAEQIWLDTAGSKTHVLQAGTLIRYFGTFSDAANMGCNMASTAIMYIILTITTNIKKNKIFYVITALMCIIAMMYSGTRTAMACFIAGLAAYVVLSKSFKIAIPFGIAFALFIFILAFTNIGNSNQQIRRMRSAFNRNDASKGIREQNQDVMRKYLKDAPWGIGIGDRTQHVPPTHKYKIMTYIAPDSEYVFFWIHTGQIGLILLIIVNATILISASIITMFRLKNPRLRGIAAAITCAFVSQQLGGYGNQVLFQFPNGLMFYGAMSIVFVLPRMEQRYNEWEAVEIEKEEKRKQLKLEKKRASRV
ncbi:MAG: O-antigen ligase family protein [Prevotella sp.]|nr:O-antigen ligase family protein [Prevotella sp.]